MNENTDIITDRLIIRNVSHSDALAIWSIWGNEQNEEYMSDPVASFKEVADICKAHEKKLDFAAGLLRVAVLKTDGTIIGTCCFGNTNKTTEWGFGYSIKPEYWGKGYATEIVRGILCFGVQCGIHNFQSSCASQNRASARVMEKCGMMFHHKRSFAQPQLNVEYEEDVYTVHIP